MCTQIHNHLAAHLQINQHRQEVHKEQRVQLHDTQVLGSDVVVLS